MLVAVSLNQKGAPVVDCETLSLPAEELAARAGTATAAVVTLHRNPSR